MKKSILLCAALAASYSAMARETGRVISSTPVMQTVAVPRQVCTTEQVGVRQGRSAPSYRANAGGRERDDDRYEGRRYGRVEEVQRCVTRTFFESRPVAYDVVYTYAGRSYAVRTATDPGRRIALDVRPVGEQVRTARASEGRTAGRIDDRVDGRAAGRAVGRQGPTVRAVQQWHVDILDRQMR